MKWWKHRNGTISVIWDLDISLSVGGCIERESKRERLCPSVKQWKHRNCTICIIQDLHISLSIGDCIERESKREREAMSICETVKTQKLYYLHNTRSAYFPINRRLHRERARERARERERLCPSMKWWKHRNGTISVIWDLDISLSVGGCIEREREQERERQRLCPSVKQWKHRNCTICIIQDLHISLSIGDCIEREQERERGYAHPWNGENTEMVLYP